MYRTAVTPVNTHLMEMYRVDTTPRNEHGSNRPLRSRRNSHRLTTKRKNQPLKKSGVYRPGDAVVHLETGIIGFIIVRCGQSHPQSDSQTVWLVDSNGRKSWIQADFEHRSLVKYTLKSA